MAPPRVHIIVLHWGDPTVTAACLESLRASDQRGAQVLLIDNGTPDRSGENLAQDFPEVKLIRSEENLGFAGGNNLGMRAALEAGAQYLVLLNNDAEVRPDTVPWLVEAAEAHPRAGMVSPKILYHDPPDTIWCAGGRHSLWTGRTREVGRGRRDRGQFDQPGPMGYANGCAVLVRRALIEEIGFLDASLFMYAEDLDWSLRAKARGWSLWYEPRAMVVHREAVRRWKRVGDAFRLRLATRNFLRVNWRHGRPWHRPIFVTWFTVRWTLYLTVKNLLLGFPGDAGAVWGGVGDALRGRTGPLPDRCTGLHE